MQLFRIFIIFYFLFTQIDSTSAAAPAELQSDFNDGVKAVCHAIRDTDDPAAELAAKHDLLDCLTSADFSKLSDLEKHLYERAAYGLFLCDPRLESEKQELQVIKKLATPVIFNDNLVYIQMPSGKLIVLEKLTAVNQPAWLQYATAEYKPYIRLGNFKDLIENMEEGLEKQSLMWMEFRPDISGIQYFHSRIEAGEKAGYDKWIAYVYGSSAEILIAERKNSSAIIPNHIEMVMTVQASQNYDTYSPMGISRTVFAAKQMLADKNAGRVVEKIKPSLSIWFHALTCKLVQTKYPNINKFWTTPVPNMQRILIKSLLPDMKSPDLKETASAWRAFFEQEPQKAKLATKVSSNRLKLPWSDEMEFGTGLPTEISAKNLLSTIFP